MGIVLVLMETVMVPWVSTGNLLPSTAIYPKTHYKKP